jgi:hypothetical protein
LRGGVEAPVPDDLAAWVAASHDRLEYWIRSQALTEATVNDSPFGDLRRALAAVEAVLAIHKPVQMAWTYPCGEHWDWNDPNEPRRSAHCSCERFELVACRACSVITDEWADRVPFERCEIRADIASELLGSKDGSGNE